MKPAIIHRTTQAELTPYETLYTDSIDYLLGGALTLRNARIDKYQFDEGYCQVSSTSSTTDNFMLSYYEKDHLGNVRQVRKVNRSRNGEVVQTNNYYPFGAELCDGNASNSVQSRKYNGKELDRMHGLNTYDYGARQYNPVTARWDRVDPFAHEYYSISAYVYCMNNPVKFVDPDGRSTWVTDLGKGKYQVVGGEIDKDNNIYIAIEGKNGYERTGKIIGKSLTPLSFYTGGKEKWAKGSVIDSQDQSGQLFLNRMGTVGLAKYMINALPKKPYDFKVTNGTAKKIDNIDTYRGMKIKTKTMGEVFASARDVGNYAAGMVAAHHGIAWSEARKAFDALESYTRKSFASECQTSQLAQKIGYNENSNSIHTINKHALLSNPQTFLPTILSTLAFPF